MTVQRGRSNVEFELLTGKITLGEGEATEEQAKGQELRRKSG